MITSMIFFPDATFYEKPEDYQFQYENAAIRTGDGINLHGWWLQAQPEKGVLLFFHGNAGNISGRLFKAKGWVDRGFSVLLVDYRGYGKSEGTIKHGKDLVADAEASWNWLIQQKGKSPGRIALYGESIGGYPAVRLAENKAAGGLILEAPFTSFKDLALKHYSVIPDMLTEALIADFKFSILEHIDNIQSPVFFIHGTQDEICPYEMGEKLFEQAPEPKGFLSIPGGMHNDLPMSGGADFWQKPYEFVQGRLSD